MLDGTSLNRVLSVLSVLAVFILLAPLWVSCSGDPPDEEANKVRQADGGRSGGENAAQAGGSEEVSGSQDSEPPAALVPITHLTSLREGVSTQELSQVRGLAVPQGYLDASKRSLDEPDLRSFGSASAVVDHVSRSPDALGLVPWDAVGPRVKVLALDGESLLEPGSRASGDYALSPEDAAMPDPENLRRIVIGGDIVLDRGQNYMVIQQGAGIDFPMDGGYAAITGRVPESSIYSETGTIHQFTAARTGGAGAVRTYLSGADLTLANFENPVIEAAVWHPDATTFTGDLRLMPVLDQAGIDGVTLGNNHILDAGTSGLAETLGHLDAAGIARAGAGMDLASAREPMIFELGDTTVGVLSYLDVPSYQWAWATASAPGTAPLEEDVVREDIDRLREEADVVIVMPHWGVEYTATPEPGQVDLAHAALDAGADALVGGHAHWPKGIELYDGKPIFYGVGNFLLDQSWSEETSTGIFAEITLYEDEVIQTEAVPFVLLDYAQPNFLLPKAGGDRALRKIYRASLGPEFEAYEGSAR